MEGYLRTHKKVLLEHQRKKKKETFMGKNMQSGIYKGLEKPSNQWMKFNMNPTKVSAIINMQEQLRQKHGSLTKV